MIKAFLKRLVVQNLAYFGRKAISKSKAQVIGITGSVGKTSTKEAIYAILEEAFGREKVYKTPKNLNSEFGLPLAILGFSHSPKRLAWITVLLMVPFKFFSSPLFNKDYFVAELAADKPGDIKHLLSIVKPKIAIITAVAPVHLDPGQFSSLEDIAQEKALLVESLPKEGVAILNGDNPYTKKIAQRLKAEKRCRVICYGQGEENEINSSALTGIKLNLLGEAGRYAALAGIAVAEALAIDQQKIFSGLAKLKPLPGRMNLLAGIKDSLIIDDTYNANPVSMAAALKELSSLAERLKELDELRVESLRSDLQLKGFTENKPLSEVKRISEDKKETEEAEAGREKVPSRRKVAILGNMNELGALSYEKHLEVGRLAAQAADLLVVIGERGKWIGEGASQAGFPEQKIVWFKTPEEAIREVPKLILNKDIILVKASQNLMRLERLVKVLLANPKEAESLLVKR
jgi:UDP-N-acetylmuramyl pentapeptide synthase